MKPKVKILIKNHNMDGLVKASMHSNRAISKKAVDALIDLVLNSYPPPMPPGGEELFIPAPLKIERISDLVFMSRVPRSLAIERLIEIVRKGGTSVSSFPKEGAAEILIHLDAIDLLTEFINDSLDSEEESGGFHGKVVMLLAEAAIRRRDIKLLKRLLITDITFYYWNTPFGTVSLLETLEEEEIIDIYTSALGNNVREAACDALRNVGGLAAHLLLSKVASKGIRKTLTALGRDDANKVLQKKVTLDALGNYETIYIVDDISERFEEATEDALRNIITRLPLEKLIQLSKSDQAHLRNPALMTVCRAADPDTLPVLILATQAEKPNVVKAAIGALRKVGGPDTVAALLPLLKHHSPDVIKAAVGALRKLGGLDTVAALLPLLKHHSRKVWLVATTALCEIGGTEAVSGILALKPERILDPVVLNGLARLGAIMQATDVLKTALEKAPYEKKLAGLEILAKNTPLDEIAELQNHFAGAYTDDLNNEKWIVRSRAVNALGKIGGPLAITALKERLKVEADGEIKTYITEALSLKDRI